MDPGQALFPADTLPVRILMKSHEEAFNGYQKYINLKQFTIAEQYSRLMETIFNQVRPRLAEVTREEAAEKIQIQWRKSQPLFRFRNLRKAVILVQSLWRMKTAKKRVQTLKNTTDTQTVRSWEGNQTKYYEDIYIGSLMLNFNFDETKSGFGECHEEIREVEDTSRLETKDADPDHEDKLEGGNKLEESRDLINAFGNKVASHEWEELFKQADHNAIFSVATSFLHTLWASVRCLRRDLSPIPSLRTQAAGCTAWVITAASLAFPDNEPKHNEQVIITASSQIVNQIEIETEKFFHMNSGLGDSSYALNSNLQKSALMLVKPLLEETVSTTRISKPETFCIADLGCSSGPNTLLTTETVVKAIQSKHANEGIPIPELHVFFSDLPSNDFNSIFRTLPPGRSYFAAGVPGSFYGRLFPQHTLHFVHSSFSLHWLSQVPAEVRDESSEAWNKGKIFISKDGPPVVSEAYARQFRKDFNAFLRARSQEMVSGGRMFLLMTGRRPSALTDRSWTFLMFETLECVMHEMVLEGLIKQAQMDSFNVPLYPPCPEELRKEVIEEGSFKIEHLEVQEIPLPKWDIGEGHLNKEAYTKMCITHVRVPLNPKDKCEIMEKLRFVTTAPFQTIVPFGRRSRDVDKAVSASSDEDAQLAPRPTTLERRPMLDAVNVVGPPPYLGGYVDKRTGKKYLHATQQTNEIMKEVQQKPEMLTRQTQIYLVKNEGTTTIREAGVQMDRPGILLDNTREYTLAPGKYVDSEERQKRREAASTTIQRYTRKWIANRKANRLRAYLKASKEFFIEQDKKYKDEAEVNLMNEMERRRISHTIKDFDVLYKELPTWYLEKLNIIDNGDDATSSVIIILPGEYLTLKEPTNDHRHHPTVDINNDNISNCSSKVINPLEVMSNVGHSCDHNKLTDEDIPDAILESTSAPEFDPSLSTTSQTAHGDSTVTKRPAKRMRKTHYDLNLPAFYYATYEDLCTIIDCHPKLWFDEDFVNSYMLAMDLDAGNANIPTVFYVADPDFPNKLYEFPWDPDLSRLSCVEDVANLSRGGGML